MAVLAGGEFQGGERHAELNARLEKLYEEWEELSV
jgi:hypothetical protein